MDNIVKYIIEDWICLGSSHISHESFFTTVKKANTDICVYAIEWFPILRDYYASLLFVIAAIRVHVVVLWMSRTRLPRYIGPRYSTLPSKPPSKNLYKSSGTSLQKISIRLSSSTWARLNSHKKNTVVVFEDCCE